MCVCMCVCVCLSVSTRLLYRLNMKKTVGYFLLLLFFHNFPFFRNFTDSKETTLILWNIFFCTFARSRNLMTVIFIHVENIKHVVHASPCSILYFL